MSPSVENNTKINDLTKFGQERFFKTNQRQLQYLHLRRRRHHYRPHYYPGKK